MAFRILFIEDSKEMAEAVSQTLKRECSFTIASSIKEAKACLEGACFDLVLLDLSLPDGEGFKICSHIRQSDSLRDIPIIFLTGREEIEDKEMAFAMGADDYIVKPVDSRELKARVVSRLQRVSRKAEESIFAGNLRLNVPLQQVAVGNGASETLLTCTPLEFKILYFLCKQEDRVFTRDQLISAAWGESVHLLDRTVDTHVSHLRKKLAAASSSHTINPVRGLGYRFSACAKSKKAS
jgi:two-component system, OmpR family, phosphate regulon response regulator PhoB